MHKFIFSDKENKDLQAANEKQKQKRTRSRRQVPHEEGLSVSEARELTEAPIEAQIAPGIPQEDHNSLPLQPRTRPHGDVEYVGSQVIGERHVQIDLVR